MIKGVSIKPLKTIVDEKGMVKHMMRRDSAEFKKFGEIYFSFIHNNAVKAWRLHAKTTLHYAIITGKIKLVLFDNRIGSPTKNEIVKIVTGGKKYELITIPPGVWYGFKGVSKETAIVANLTDLPHDPKEIKRMDPMKNTIFSYDWSKT